jgi:hypothetical protein
VVKLQVQHLTSLLYLVELSMSVVPNLHKKKLYEIESIF